ncbi:MAG: hypothetical protein ACXIT9_10150 [Nitritalea sp.]
MKHRESDEKALSSFFSALKEQDEARFGLKQERQGLRISPGLRPSANGQEGSRTQPLKQESSGLTLHQLWYWAAATAALLLLGIGVSWWSSGGEEPRELAQRGVLVGTSREAVAVPASELDLFSVGLDEEGQLEIEIWQYANYEIWQADSDILLYD